jgi:hypothetical protein
MASLSSPAGASSGVRTHDTKDGISFVLPTGWAQVSLNGSDIGALLGSASKVDASLQKVLTAQAKSAVEKGLKFFAVSPGAKANVNIDITSGSPSVSKLDVESKLGITSAGGKHVKAKKVRYRFATAIEVTYTLPISGSATPVNGTQFYFVHGKHMYITTFSADLKSMESAAATAMMPTWQFTR